MAAKLEKVKQAKKEKLTRLGDIIDKVVSTQFDFGSVENRIIQSVIIY